jgi:hypothetical protein
MFAPLRGGSEPWFVFRRVLAPGGCSLRLCDRLASRAEAVRAPETANRRDHQPQKQSAAFARRQKLEGTRANTRAVALDTHLERLLRALRPPNRSQWQAFRWRSSCRSCFFVLGVRGEAIPPRSGHSRVGWGERSPLATAVVFASSGHWQLGPVG